MPRMPVYFTVQDFPGALKVTIENKWIVIWLETCRIKFKDWNSQ